MREGSSHKLGTVPALDGSQGAQGEAKSLFRNILPASPSGSRFWPHYPISQSRKSFRTSILADRSRKIIRTDIPALPSRCQQNLTRECRFAVSSHHSSRGVKCQRKPTF